MLHSNSRCTLVFLIGALICCANEPSVKVAALDAGASTDSQNSNAQAECSTDFDCTVEKPYCGTNNVCGECLTNEQCNSGKLCYQQYCVRCDKAKTACAGNAVVLCNDTEDGFTPVEVCDEGVECLAGQCLVCYPGTKRCEGNISYECRLDGTGWEIGQDCSAESLQCALGVCLSPCSSDFKANTNVGCGFYAVDLDNATSVVKGKTWDASKAQFAVIASNVSTSQDVTVEVSAPDGSVQTQTVKPRSLGQFLLPSSYGLDGTMRGKSVFEITSSAPISVYQFNPLDNEFVFSNDASVLLPVAASTGEYYVMSHRQVDSQFRSFFAVVGVTQQTTLVTITPTATTQAGDGIPALSPGQSYDFSLERGEVVNIESNAPGADLTGTYVKATGPVQVFAGHEAAVTGDLCCADHLEEQMVSVDAWGTEYIVSRSMKRWAENDHFRVLAANDGTEVTITPSITTPSQLTLNKGEFKEFQADGHFKVSATKPVMVAQYLASSMEILPNLKPGGMCESSSDCPMGYGCSGVCKAPECTSNASCPPGHVCASDSLDGDLTPSCRPIGDPAMMLAVPTNQWRTDYVFLSPDSYLQDYINIVAEKGTTVSLDGDDIPNDQYEPVSGSDYHVYRALISDGIHSLSADRPVAITVYGYDKDVSYGYPGGLGLATD